MVGTASLCILDHVNKQRNNKELIEKQTLKQEYYHLRTLLTSVINSIYFKNIYFKSKRLIKYVMLNYKAGFKFFKLDMYLYFFCWHAFTNSYMRRSHCKTCFVFRLNSQIIETFNLGAFYFEFVTMRWSHTRRASMLLIKIY